MKHSTLTVKTRQIFGKNLKKLRRQNQVPAVIYGNEFDSLAITVDLPDFRKLYKTSGQTNVVDLIIDGKKQPVLIQELDLHPVKGNLRHIDFLAVNLKEEVEARVPIVLTGEAPAVKEFGAVLANPVTELTVKALPDKIPEAILIDVSILDSFDKSVHVRDLQTSKDYQILDELDLTLVALSAQSIEEDPNSNVAAEAIATANEETKE